MSRQQRHCEALLPLSLILFLPVSDNRGSDERAMKWCQSHWDELRGEVRKQGLDSLIPGSGADAAKAFTRQVEEGAATVDSFDPLMGAMFSMMSFIDNSFSVVTMFVDGCPICWIDEQHKVACTDVPCEYGSVAKFFPNAVGEQRAAWEAMRP